MFVKKLVEKVSQKSGGNLNGLKPGDVNPRLVFHYGIPAGSISLAYDSIQKILAISTKDGRIKLLGKDNTQVILESSDTVPSKFLQFFENQGILINVTVQNHIEVWNVDKKQLAHVHAFEEKITSFTVMQQSLYMFVGDSLGNVSILKLDQEPCQIVKMNYNIPFSASHGNTTELADDNAVTCLLPQPTAESKRVLTIFRDGLIVLWGIQESRAIFVTGGNILHSLRHEAKKVTSACWACPFGSKVVVGYSNGEIYLWSIPPSTNRKSELATEKEELCATQSAPISKLILGYKMDKTPIISLKWVYADGKASRLYVMGASSSASSNLLQVIILNEHSESRTIKLVLPLDEPCLHMEMISSTSDESKHKQDYLVLLLKSSRLCMYDDSLIEKYLLQCQSRSPPSIPKEVMVKLPYADSSITVAKFITDDPSPFSYTDKDYILLAKTMLPLLPVEMKGKDGKHINSTHFSGFGNIKNLYITGHCDGGINLWDVSCPYLFPILSIKQQNEDDYSLSGVPVSALYFDRTCRVLVSGDQSGLVRIFKFKSEPFNTENSFLSLQGSTKKGRNHAINSVKVIKVNGSVLSININREHLSIGSDQGYVTLVDMEKSTVIFEKRIMSELCTGVISIQFETCSFHGFEKNVILVATIDSSVLALERDTGNMLSTSMVRPKKPSKALFMQILDRQDVSPKGFNTSDGLDLTKRNSVEDAISKQSFLLLCSEKAVYLYSLNHVIQGVKKVQYKKKFHAIACCWASTFCTPSSDVGLVLLFTSGKIEIRSLPELSLLKETSIRGFTFSNSKQCSYSDSSVCSSSDGELLLVNGDQEISFVSVLNRMEVYRLLDPIGQVYKKDVITLQEGHLSAPLNHKEKKRGVFSSVMKDLKGDKPKYGMTREAEESRLSIEELSTVFSTANFPSDARNRDNIVMDDDELDLNIDDIDLEDPGEKPKGHNMIPALNKKNLTSKFQAIKGKLKHMKIKNEKTSVVENEDEKSGTVDQIKKKYGFPLSGESSHAKMAESKLNENLKKLQGINTRSAEMQDTAQSFSSLAKEMLRIAEKDKQNS